MPLKNYGVMKGRVIGSRPGTGPSPHYQINVVAGSTQYRVAVNVKSQLAPSELLYLIVEDFRHPLTVGLPELSHGFSEVPHRPRRDCAGFHSRQPVSSHADASSAV